MINMILISFNKSDWFIKSLRNSLIRILFRISQKWRMPKIFLIKVFLWTLLIPFLKKIDSFWRINKYKNSPKILLKAFRKTIILINRFYNSTINKTNLIDSLPSNRNYSLNKNKNNFNNWTYSSNKNSKFSNKNSNHKNKSFKQKNIINKKIKKLNQQKNTNKINQ
jgi:hypothetical protein